MDNFGNSTYNGTCACRRTFTYPAALKNHQNSCIINRENLSTALNGARKFLEERKLKRKERILNNLNPGSRGQLVSSQISSAGYYIHIYYF